ncbi:MAG TPA: MCE family protein [Mycobacteriales bacterium]|nr:MCE family protein [Mycobacteriales bacterium]
MKPFRERNPLPIGIIGVLVILGFLAVGLEAGNLPFINSGHTVYANFADAAGLQNGDNVRVAGVLVGKVKSVKLDGNVVKVGMKVNGSTHVDAGSKAAIKIETLLGQVYVALQPTGTTALPHNTIVVADTTTPTSITTAFTGLGERAGEINVNQLAESFDVLASTFKNTPGDVRSSLTGLERLSATIASRNAQLTALLGHTNVVTNTLATHDAQIAKLINDSNLILDTVNQQRRVIHTLLIDTSKLSHQLTSLVAENRAVIGPALIKLNGTLTILRTNQKNLDETVHLVAPFVRNFTDTLGNGRWFETVIANITDVGPAGLKTP